MSSWLVAVGVTVFFFWLGWWARGRYSRNEGECFDSRHQWADKRSTLLQAMWEAGGKMRERVRKIAKAEEAARKAR